jgi:hypothetical protein
MASVKIDLGFGAHAILSERTVSETATVRHQRDTEEFLRRWPQTRSIQQERGYLQQLGLHLGYSPSGANPSDPSALLRSAVQSGKVTVVIERAATPTGGGVSASGPTRPPYPLSERVKTAWVAPTPKSRSYDWLQRYDDVSADDLINYIQSVVGGALAAAATDSDSSTPLVDAQPFAYAGDTSFDGQAEQDAGFFLTPEIEAECEHGLNLDLDECSAWEAAKPGTWSMCHSRSMERYSNCLRGRTLD